MRSQQPQPTTLGDLRPEDLREAARFVDETALEALIDLEDQGFPLAMGNGREFPRESPQQRAAVRGLAILQETATDAIAALYALAEALERKIDVPRSAFVPIEPYLAAFLEARRADDDKS